MKFWSFVLSGALCVLCSLAMPVMATERSLARGTLVAFDGQTGSLSLQGYAGSFTVSPDAVMVWQGLSRPLLLIENMEVSLYGADREAVARVEVHGPFSLTSQIDHH